MIGNPTLQHNRDNCGFNL